MTHRLITVRSTEYYIFSDESMHNQGRYRSISALIIPKTRAKDYHYRLLDILREYQIQTEFGWTSINGHSFHTKCGKELIQFVINSEISVITIIWDTQDSRHAIRGRDDTQNFSRMYYHLINHILNTFPDDIFYWFPDQKNGVKWNTLKECIYCKHNTGWSGEYVQGEFRIDFGEQLKKVLPVISTKYPFIQIADLFAGMAAFSYNNKEEYEQWLREKQGIQLLFEQNDTPLSKKCKHKVHFLHDFLGLKEHKVRMKNGLWTPSRIGMEKPKLNFWLYSPQTFKDQAPVKEEKEYVFN